MEFKSTLERTSERMKAEVKRLHNAGIEVPPLVLAVNKLIENSPKFQFTFDCAIKNARTIQPSMSEEDCRIAVCLQLTLASQLVYNLIDANILKIVK